MLGNNNFHFHGNTLNTAHLPVKFIDTAVQVN